jgi:ferrous iron transport protein B
VLLGALESYPRATGAAAADVQLSQSALGHIGHAVEPAVRPLGLDWKIGVAMVASFAAREVFVSTMATMYGISRGTGESGALAGRLREARGADGRVSYSRAAAFGLLAFYVFALMCTSTIAVTVRETGGGWRGAGWAAFQFTYMLALAWGSAFVVYRAGLAIGLGGLA